MHGTQLHIKLNIKYNLYFVDTQWHRKIDNWGGGGGGQYSYIHVYRP